MSINVFSQSFLKAEGKKIVNESGDEVILKGMGLGGWMLQEGYMLKTADFANSQHEIRSKIQELIGEDATNAFYDAWLENHVRKIDIDSLAAWGFNCVRLPMHYNLYTLPIEDEPVQGENTWLEKGFELTDRLLSWCSDNQMYLILDLHAAPGGQGYDQGISDYNPNKPSLWESKLNRDKTVALWKKLAERYSNEKWIAGYDLINETNWDLPGNTALRNLYLEITDSIRDVDQNHILFIEGNWFANDFTGLTPPWDDNLVYSFHKYWSHNNDAAIQWVLDIRENFNVPIWLGESGENSNVWFRDCIALMNTHGIGWAWWPMKKIDDIAGPLSVNRSPEYQQLLDYWSTGSNKPNAEFATSTLMQLTEDIKLENCRYQKDVIHAMFSQVEGNATISYSENIVPGIVYATDFDIGRNETAYSDKVVANYHITTGNYTSWNDGWGYRNDGVDIQNTEDEISSNGYNVGWIETNEWMNYTIYAEKEGYYDITVRVAAEGNSGGRFHFENNGQPVSEVISVPQTGGWQIWKSIYLRNVYLTHGTSTIKFVCDVGGFNLNSFNFKFKFENFTGLDDIDANADIKIYPNPSTEILNLEFSKEIEEVKSYSLLNVQGSVIKSEPMEVQSLERYTIDLMQIPEGIYVLQIEFSDNIRSFKIMVEK
jgi:hypothetical protein